MSAAVDACSVVSGAALRVRPNQRPQLYREIMAHAAAGLVVMEGNKEAAEAVYRLADAVAVRD